MFNNNVVPACLPTDSSRTYTGYTAYVSGEIQDKEEKDSAVVAEISIVQKIQSSNWSVDEILNCDSSKLLILI